MRQPLRAKQLTRHRSQQILFQILSNSKSPGKKRPIRVQVLRDLWNDRFSQKTKTKQNQKIPNPQQQQQQQQQQQNKRKRKRNETTHESVYK